MTRSIFRWMKRLFNLALFAGFIMLIIILEVQLRYLPHLHSESSKITQASYAIILGAGVTKKGIASDVLHDRVVTGVKLYHEKKVEKLLMTGDDGKFHTDEVSVMKKLAVDFGVLPEHISVDPHGYRTYESCKRAAQTFGIHDAIIVTQRFHLARAVYLCEHFGIKSQGLSADLQKYQLTVFFTIRDLTASVKAWIDTYIRAPKSPVDWGN